MGWGYAYSPTSPDGKSRVKQYTYEHEDDLELGKADYAANRWRAEAGWSNRQKKKAGWTKEAHAAAKAANLKRYADLDARGINRESQLLRQHKAEQAMGEGWANAQTAGAILKLEGRIPDFDPNDKWAEERWQVKHDKEWNAANSNKASSAHSVLGGDSSKPIFGADGEGAEVEQKATVAKKARGMVDRRKAQKKSNEGARIHN
jgi:hypothetical protein